MASGGGAQPVDVAADLHHKMCKKIAQLTKVIYHLNTKNDDHEWEMRSLSDQYESEISEILKDAGTKMKLLKQQLEEQLSADRVNQALQQLVEQHQKEKEEALKGFEAFKKKVRANESRLVQAGEGKAQQLLGELNSVKAEFQKRVEEFTKATTAMQGKSTDDLAALKQQKSEEMEDLVRTYNEKYKAMLAQQLEEKEALRAELEKAMEKKVAQCKLEEERTRNRLTAELDQLRSKHQDSASASAASHAKALEDLQGKLTAASAEAAELQQQLQAQAEAH
eukprot:RCo011881